MLIIPLNLHSVLLLPNNSKLAYSMIYKKIINEVKRGLSLILTERYIFHLQVHVPGLHVLNVSHSAQSFKQF